MNKACGHHRAHGLSTAAVRRAVTAAEARCAAAGERWTEPRRRVFEQLLRAGGPVKAYDLIAAYAPGVAPTKPPTVYRALEFLETLGLAHRIASLNAYVPCGQAEAVHAASFLICDCCGSAEEFEPGIDVLAHAAAQRSGFRPIAMALEVRGLCRSCAG